MKVKFDLSQPSGMRALLTFIKDRHIGSQPDTFDLIISNWIHVTHDFKQLQLCVRTKARSYKTLVKPALASLKTHFSIEYDVQHNKADNVVTLIFDDGDDLALNALTSPLPEEEGTKDSGGESNGQTSVENSAVGDDALEDDPNLNMDDNNTSMAEVINNFPDAPTMDEIVAQVQDEDEPSKNGHEESSHTTKSGEEPIKAEESTVKPSTDVETHKMDTGMTHEAVARSNEKPSDTVTATQGLDTSYAQAVSNTNAKPNEPAELGSNTTSEQPVLKNQKSTDQGVAKPTQQLTQKKLVKWYYAVRKGKHPGVYTDWKVCEKMVKGYSGAVYKKFPTQQQAEQFIADEEVRYKTEMVEKYYAVKRGRSTGIYLEWHEVEQLTSGYTGALFQSFSTLEQAQAYLEQDNDNFTNVTAKDRHSSPTKQAKPTEATFATHNPFDVLEGSQQESDGQQGIMQAAIRNVHNRTQVHFDNKGSAVRVKHDGSTKPDNYMSPSAVKPSPIEQIQKGNVAVVHAKQGEALDMTNIPRDVSILKIDPDGSAQLSFSQEHDRHFDIGPIRENAADGGDNQAMTEDDEVVFVKEVVPDDYVAPPAPYLRYHKEGYLTIEKMIEHDFLHLCNQRDVVWYISQTTSRMMKQKGSILGSMAQKERDALKHLQQATENETLNALGKIGQQYQQMEGNQKKTIQDAKVADNQLKNTIMKVQEAHRLTNEALQQHHDTARSYKDTLDGLAHDAVATATNVNAMQAQVKLQDQQLQFYRDQWTASKERLDKLEQVVERLQNAPVPDQMTSTHVRDEYAHPDRPTSSNQATHGRSASAASISVADSSDDDSDEIAVVPPPPHKCQTFVLIRKSDGTNERVWLLNWRVHNQRNFYYAKDAKDEKHIFYQDDIVAVLALPRVKENIGTHGYPPGRAATFPGEDKWVETVTLDPPGTPVTPKVPKPPITPRFEVPSNTLFPDAAKMFAMEQEHHGHDHSGMHDEGESHHPHSRPYHTRYRTYTANDLDAHQYVYPKNSATYYTSIKESYIMEKASTLFQKYITDEKDVPMFYNDLKDKLYVYGIRMKAYVDLEPEESIFMISEENCLNYQAAYTTMSRCLYRVLDEHKTTFFPHHTKLCDLSEVYEDDKDGESYLLAVIRMEHKNFKHLTKQSKGILQELVIPPFTSEKRLLPWLNELKKYARDKEITPYKIFTYVRLQLREDARFDKALVEMDRISDEYAGGTGYMPKQFHIGELGTYILDQYNEAEGNLLSQSKKDKPYGIKHLSSRASSQGSMTITHLSEAQEDELDTIRTLLNDDQYYVPEVYEDFLCSSMESSGATINQMTTRSQRRNNYQSNRRPEMKSPGRTMQKAASYANDKRQSKSNMKPPTDHRCPACLGPHKLEECKRVGPFLAMSEWLQKQSPAKQREVLQAYVDNIKTAHRRYEERYAKRMGIQNTIRLCDMQGDTREAFLQA